MLERIVSYSNAFGPSGLEHEIRQLVQKDLVVANVDSLQNVWATKAGDELTVLLDAHLDEVGFIIQEILENGTCLFLPLGGFVKGSMPGTAVRVRDHKGQDHLGIIGTLPPHFGEQSGQLTIDLGTSSRQETLDLGVEIGDFVVPATQASVVGSRIAGKAFDCRVGLAAMVETFLTTTSKHTIIACGSAQEEVGERGMMAMVQRIKPDFAICFEGCPADDTFDGLTQTALGKGPMVRHFDKSMITHPGLMRRVIDVAKQQGIPLQRAVRQGGGTNGGILHVHDIPTVVIGIPVRYAHSPIGWMDLKDAEQAVRLAKALIE